MLEAQPMNLVFNIDGIICSPHEDHNHCKPIENIVEFMQWVKTKNHHITIWCERELTAENKYVTEQWLTLEQIPYNRLLFDRPKEPVFVSETPSHAKYYPTIEDNDIVAMLFEEWKDDARAEYVREMKK